MPEYKPTFDQRLSEFKYCLETPGMMWCLSPIGDLTVAGSIDLLVLGKFSNKFTLEELPNLSFNVYGLVGKLIEAGIDGVGLNVPFFVSTPGIVDILSTTRHACIYYSAIREVSLKDVDKIAVVARRDFLWLDKTNTRTEIATSDILDSLGYLPNDDFERIFSFNRVQIQTAEDIGLSATDIAEKIMQGVIRKSLDSQESVELSLPALPWYNS